jgi:DNA polymerase delta subunit 1
VFFVNKKPEEITTHNIKNPNQPIMEFDDDNELADCETIEEEVEKEEEPEAYDDIFGQIATSGGEDDSFVTANMRMPALSLPLDTQYLELQVIDIECQRRAIPDESLQDPSLPYGVKPFMVPCMRIYCKNKYGNSICLNTYGYFPVVHLLTSINKNVLCCFLEDIATHLNDLLRDKNKKGNAVLDVKIVKGFPATPYTQEPYDFLEVKLSEPFYINKFEVAIRGAQVLDMPNIGVFRVLPYSCEGIVEKFQVKYGISGFGWIRVPFSRCIPTSYDGKVKFGQGDRSFCQAEFDTRADLITPFVDDSIAPLRAITFDIECATSKGFPDAERGDPVILIAAICTEYINAEPTNKVKYVFQYGSASPIKDVNHLCFPNEFGVLNAFGQLLRAFDPDYICGHNIIGFDIPYVTIRGNAVCCPEMMFLGRRGAYDWQKPRKVVKKRKNGDVRTTFSTSIPGRIQLDTYTWILGIEKRRSYSLASISCEYLGDTKEDVGYAMIVPLWKQSDDTRRRLAVYCLKDAYLTQELVDLDIETKSYKMIMNSVEKSRQTHVCCGKLLRCGAQVRLWTLILEKAAHPGFDDKDTPVFFPAEAVNERDKDDKFRGAEVLEPYRGYYEGFVGCGDFRSLYPSIIILLNICYTTLINSTDEKYKELPCNKSPIGTLFVDKNVRVGLLAQIEIELMADRDEAKNKMKEAKTSGRKSMYNSRQNEIKVNCNTIYGIMTASGGKLVRMEMGESVTSQGREMILQAKRIAEEISKQFNVIYGDTDSIFINFVGCKTMEEAFDNLKRICDAVTASFPKPVMLQPEKVMRHLILTNKKRYLSALYMSPTSKPKIDVKGIELARRDNCPFVVKAMKTIVDKLILEMDRTAAIDHINSVLSGILGNRIEISDLVISKSYSKEVYKIKPAHIHLMERMKHRDPSYECNPGDRIPYVVVNAGGKKLTENTEDPLWAITHNMPLNSDYYIQNQLAGPVSRILMWIYGSSDDKRAVQLAEEQLRIRNIAENKTKLVKAINMMQEHVQTMFFGKRALSVFVKAQQSTSRQVGKIDSFFTVEKRKRSDDTDSKCDKPDGINSCILCGRYTKDLILPNGVCRYCHSLECYKCGKPLEPMLIHGPCFSCSCESDLRHKSRQANQHTDIEDLKKQFHEATEKCTQCRGYADDQIKCVQKDCSNLYRRATLSMQIPQEKK